MHSPTCVSAVVCVARKPRPCLSYSRRRDRIHLVLLRSYYKGGGGRRGNFWINFLSTHPCARLLASPLPAEPSQGKARIKNNS